MNCEDFDFENAETPEEIIKLLEEKGVDENFQINNIWHEIGHLFGIVISKRLGFDIYEVIEVSFVRKNSYVKLEDNMFKLRKHLPASPDYYGLKNVYIEGASEVDSKLENNEYKLEDLFKYLIYSLCGGILELYFHKGNNPDLNDFENCFNNDEDNIENIGLNGCAGNDWDKVRFLISREKISLELFKKFRNKLFWILLENNFFNHIKEFIQETYEKHRNKKLDKNEAQCLLLKAEECFDKSPNRDKIIKEMDDEIKTLITKHKGMNHD